VHPKIIGPGLVCEEVLSGYAVFALHDGCEERAEASSNVKLEERVEVQDAE
jgi:hypothetical protein